jgi:hypothetical protein
MLRLEATFGCKFSNIAFKFQGKQVQDTFKVKGPAIQTVKDNIFYWQIENPTKNIDDLMVAINENKEMFLADRFGSKQ